MKSLLIFDLDGTLIDSRQDLAKSVNAMLSFLGREPLDEARIASYVGSGAPVLVRRALGDESGPEEIERGLEFFLRYYAEHKLDNTVLYPGVASALEQFHRQGAAMSVLTNKPVRMSREIVAGLGLDGYFFQVFGGNSFEFKKPHAVGIETLMGESGIGPAQTIMVGDSSVDVQTACNAGVRACGVTYGFQPETFAEHPPDIFVDRLDELAAFL